MVLKAKVLNNQGERTSNTERKNVWHQKCLWGMKIVPRMQAHQGCGYSPILIPTLGPFGNCWGECWYCQKQGRAPADWRLSGFPEGWKVRSRAIPWEKSLVWQPCTIPPPGHPCWSLRRLSNPVLIQPQRSKCLHADNKYYMTCICKTNLHKNTSYATTRCYRQGEMRNWNKNAICIKHGISRRYWLHQLPKLSSEEFLFMLLYSWKYD